MIVKKKKPPPTERAFRSPWFELDYLCTKIDYWLYNRQECAKARRYLTRLRKVLEKLPENDLAIVRQEGWSLLYELEGDLTNAIAHRKREIELIEHLHREAELPRYDEETRAYMLQNYGVAELKWRRDHLVSLQIQRSERNGAPTR